MTKSTCTGCDNKEEIVYEEDYYNWHYHYGPDSDTAGNVAYCAQCYRANVKGDIEPEDLLEEEEVHERSV